MSSAAGEKRKRERAEKAARGRPRLLALVLAMFEVPSPEAYKHRPGVVTSYYAAAKLTVSLDR